MITKVNKCEYFGINIPGQGQSMIVNVYVIICIIAALSIITAGIDIPNVHELAFGDSIIATTRLLEICRIYNVRYAIYRGLLTYSSSYPNDISSSN